MTEAEQKLWYHLRAKRLGGHKFRQQQPIGPYIADFYCAEANLIIEADGSQHLDNAHDARRDAWLGGQGYYILRFWNSDITQNMTGVLEVILAALNDPSPNSLKPSPKAPYPLPQGERNAKDR
jgi:very-short-patch-repair endonuclease